MVMVTISDQFNLLHVDAFEQILILILIYKLLHHLHPHHHHHLIKYPLCLPMLSIRLMVNSKVNIQIEMVEPAQSIVLPLTSHLLVSLPQTVTQQILLACEKEEKKKKKKMSQFSLPQTLSTCHAFHTPMSMSL